MQGEWVGSGKSRNDLMEERAGLFRTWSGEEIKDRALGRHFTPMELLWDQQEVAVDAECFETIRRTPEQGQAYDLCRMYVDDDSKLMRKTDSRSGSTNADRNSVRVDAYGNMDTDAAHLFPYAAVCHKAFGFLAEAAVGFIPRQEEEKGEEKEEEEEEEEEERVNKKQRKASDSTAATNSDARKRLKILNGIRGIQNTSLKSHKYNKMCLKEQHKIYDGEHPSVLVIPMLSLSAVLDWARTDDTPYDILTLTFGADTAASSAASLLQYAPQTCVSVDEMEQSRSLLETFVTGVAGSLVENDVLESFDETELNSASNPSLLAWKALVERIKARIQKINIPTRRSPPPANLRVAKARLSTGNSLPDPWLLMVKAAINYSSSHHTKLMPACRQLRDDEIDDGPPNTDQGWEDYYCDQKTNTSIDHAAQLAMSLQRGGQSIELFNADDE